MSFKCLFDNSVKHEIKTRQIKVVTVFLYKFLDEIIYFKQLNFLEYNFELVCFLRKALYRFKQALQTWYPTLLDLLWKIRLEQLPLDHGVFV